MASEPLDDEEDEPPDELLLEDELSDDELSDELLLDEELSELVEPFALADDAPLDE